MQHRTTGTGIIPYDVFARMTPDERVRVIGLNRAVEEPETVIAVSRTKTPEMEQDKLDELKAKSKE